MKPAETLPRLVGRRADQLLGLGKGLTCFAVNALLIITLSLVAVAAFQPQDPLHLSEINRIDDDKCLSCHQAQKDYLATAHHLTSRLPTRESIAGRFGEGENILKTSEPELHYRMEAKKDGFYQTALLRVSPDTVTISERFDLVIGSGRKGQTYLYWGKGDQLFQLPVSYWTELAKWVHSPGYDDKSVNFSRPILPRCLECHATFFESILDPLALNRYRKANYILGISCDRCHGPGQKHVALQLAKTAKSSEQAIVNPAKLPRRAQLGLCALCHGGIGIAKAPTFSYTAGNDLEKFIHLEVPGPSDALDVHGNQVALLERSRCFQSSNMTCSTCHNVHIPQRDVVVFSASCLKCHKTQSCGLFRKKGRQIAGKCIDCHLPNQRSNMIISSRDGRRVQPSVRNHWIKVYPELGTP